MNWRERLRWNRQMRKALGRKDFAHLSSLRNHFAFMLPPPEKKETPPDDKR